MSINKVCISGNLGRDPELRATASGMSVCRFSVCVNDRRKNRQGEWVDVPNWVDVTFFGNRAESISQHLSKGSLVFVSGRLHQSTWEKDGQKRSKLEIVGDDIQFGGNRQGQQQPAQHQGYQQQGYQPQQYQQSAQQPGYGYQQQMPDMYDEDILF